MCAAVAPLAGRGISAAVSAARAEALPSVGKCWLEAFDVIDASSAAPGVETLWRARRVDTGVAVELRLVADGGDPLRAEAWSRLCGIELPQLTRALESVAVGEQRVEVSEAVRGETLRAWRARRTKVDVALVETFVAHMAEALGALHAHGLVHLAVHPETIFVEEEAAGPRFVLAGLSRVAVSDRTERLALAADPFYAPPEAATLVEHPPGAALCAWDWWTLGRAAQELFLGRHIFAQLLNCDVTQPTADARAKAELYLLEPDGQKGMRAGAVELMAPLDARIDLLLRGLLATAVQGRWGTEFVDRWLRKMPVKEHYTSPRADVWFRWRGKPHTPAEVAAVLRTAKEWSGAAEHLWEAGKPGTLAHFLKRSEPQKKIHDQLTDLLALATAPALKPWPAELVREVLTAVALLQLAGPAFLWRGERLGDDVSAERVALLRVLTTRPVLQEIERSDSDAARTLAELAKHAAEAEALVRRTGPIGSSDGDVTAAFFKLALEPLAALQAQREELRRNFPSSTLAAVQRLAVNERPSRPELMALAWMGREPKRYGFLTAAEAQRQEAERLRTRGVAVATACFWARLERALAAGPLVFGGLAMVAAGWAPVAVVAAVIFPGIGGILAAVAVLGGVLGVRALAAGTIAGVAKQFAPNAKPWSWRDGAERCRAELTASPESGDAATLAAAQKDITTELAKLTLVEPRPALLSVTPRFAGTRLLAIGSWVVLLAAIGALGWRGKMQPPTAERHRAAWGLREPGTRDPNEPVLVSWPYKPGDNAEVVTIVRSFEASKEQIKATLASGQVKVAPYRKDTISTLVILPVPEAEPNAVMIFEGIRGTLVNPKVYVMSYRPLARAWVEVGGQKGIYLPD